MTQNEKVQVIAANAAEFSAEMKRLWEKVGSITKSIDFVEQHPVLASRVGKTGQAQRRRVYGELELLTGGVTIPERARGVVYPPISGKIMYCVYSTPAFNSNGYSTRTRGVANGLKAAGGDVVVVARAGYPWDWKTDVPVPEEVRSVVEIDGIDYVHLPNGNMSAFAPNVHIEQAADAFVQEALIQRPSSIQAASSYRAALPALIAARRLGVPFVYEVRGLWEVTGVSNDPKFAHTERYTMMRDIESRLVREADMVLAITKQVAEELIARGVKADRIRLAPNAVDPTLFSPRRPDLKLARQLDLTVGVPTIGFAGSMVKYEGLESLLEASKILVERGVDHRVVFAGSGNTEERLRQLVVESGMDCVKFLGRLPQDQIPKFLNLCDIVVTPRASTVITELVSALKPLEAFASGRPTVLSDVAPNVELAGESGLRAALFEADNPEHFADILQQQIENPRESSQMAKRAREWIEAERTWEAIGHHMLEAHENAAKVFEDNIVPFPGLAVLHCGIIASTPTVDAIDSLMDVTPISRSWWSSQLDQNEFDFIFVEASLEAGGLSWRDGIAHVDNQNSRDLRELLNAAKTRGIRTVMWNPGTSESFEQFRPNVKYFETLLTADYSVTSSIVNSPETEHLHIGVLPAFLDVKNQNPYQNQTRNAPTNGVALLTGQSTHSRVLQNGPISELVPVLKDLPGAVIATGDNGRLHRSAVRDANGDEIFDEEWLNHRDLLGSYDMAIVNAPNEEIIPTEALIAGARGIPVMLPGGKAVDNWFPGLFLNSLSSLELRALTEAWRLNPSDRLDVVWTQLRRISRSYTAQVRYEILARSLGFPVEAGAGRVYGLEVDFLTDSIVNSILGQSIRPSAIAVKNLKNEFEKDLTQGLRAAGIRILNNPSEQNIPLWGRITTEVPSTFYEDLLLTMQMGNWSAVTAATKDSGHLIAKPDVFTAVSSLSKSDVDVDEQIQVLIKWTSDNESLTEENWNSSVEAAVRNYVSTNLTDFVRIIRQNGLVGFDA
ncbi:GDP-mannose-dependent alpha-(1-6)-phosphatidylinositol monomannoside mannosyltransferase [Corynebacterium faecale]|uniref:glycosyltransferase family 4 protein n=1 Tax=Corynebacterium faecale TaxID=1758466 RepID=UPI0025B5FD9A|nr:glycosyltransferase family 4 protein [Corynebacterium faecale]WJY91892.1 GDP-mannose-dependent alpha-(1-6)-phosphatidylinositol monomannoside mannosyltransferase [Corynebacterium faecale]